MFEIVTAKDRAILVAFADDLDLDLAAGLGKVAGNALFYLRALQTDGARIYASLLSVKT